MPDSPALTAYYCVKQRWLTYQQQLQFLNEQTHSLLDALDDRLLKQIPTLTQAPLPAADCFSTQESRLQERLQQIDIWVNYLLTQHQIRRRQILTQQQAEQAALTAALQQECQQPLQQILGALVFQPSLRPARPPLQ